MCIPTLRLATLFFVISRAASAQSVPASPDLDACLAAESILYANELIVQPPFAPIEPMPNAWPVPDRSAGVPVLVNGSEMVAVLGREYPQALRNAGIGGLIQLWLFIDAEGSVRAARVVDPSRFPELDEAARRVGCSMRFAPATRGAVPVPVWYPVPIPFQPR
jgi:TonB family protein